MAEDHSIPSPKPHFRVPAHYGPVPSPCLEGEGLAGLVAMMNHSPASSRTIGNSPEPARPHTPARPHMASSAPAPEATSYHGVPGGPNSLFTPVRDVQTPKLTAVPVPTPPVPGPRPTHSKKTWTGPLPVSNLSTTDFRTRYPSIGKLAMLRSGPEEVVVAGPDGLAYFRRVLDHPSKPWSQPLPFPWTEASLNSSTVTGLAMYQDMDHNLRVYCVADGKMHAFSSPGDLSEGFIVDSCPAFEDFEIKGTPAATTLSERVGGIRPDRTLRWGVVVPWEHGGLLYTETKAPRIGSYDIFNPPEQRWEGPSLIAEHLTEISAVAIAVPRTYKTPRIADDSPTEIVAVCINAGRLHSIEGLFKPASRGETWDEGAQDIPIQHPGVVVGNPVLLSDENEEGEFQLDLLVPYASADGKGGIFHFIRTTNTLREWHMIGRVSFPMSSAPVSSLACMRLGWPQLGDNSAPASYIHAIVQCDGKLYFIKTSENATPWVESQLYPNSWARTFSSLITSTISYVRQDELRPSRMNTCCRLTEAVDIVPEEDSMAP